MTTKLMTLTVALLLIVTGLKAQEEKKVATAQVSFAYPLGTNGHSSMHIANNYSFNILYGVNGGVKQFELGGIGNQNMGDVSGVQIGGLVNITDGASTGAIISGIANITSQSANGLHLTGITNYTQENANGAQISGIANVNGGTSIGLMLSGLANVAVDDMTGAQIGFINTAHQSMSGFQLGFINFANKMKGFQLGFINVADSLGGAALGFISIAKNGYYAFEASNSEVMYANLSYKMGKTQLYNIYTAGYSKYNNKDVYSYGLGLGTLIPLHKRHALAIEGVTNHIVYDSNWDELNLLNKMNLTYQFHVTKCISLIGGPSLNFYITDQKVDGKYGTLDMPSTIWKHEGNSNGQYMWIGYNVGINIRL
ncbi:hypothetical protein KEM09_13875 [Carboxylicivirga mesophila]|uniref:Uncharacterized protein n=1 Tax=Carboxylicivirga mesophila TaxID=1166478 RepID=A0ABS5KBY5_9BACT|nr:hypothetical protein [Carboxylicivirga mesophila]MBS2212500.1 hypothetical protein [Carboxylicivirga mesophila]